MAAHHLLGKVDEGNLVLLAGPDYARILDLAESSGIRFRKATGLAEAEEVEALKKEISSTQESVVVIASMPEIEGRLDRSTFDRNLTTLAFAADRVVYAGKRAAVLIWPEAQGVRRALNDGHVIVTQNLDVVAKGESVTGLTVDRL